MSKYGVFSGPYFSVFGLTTGRFETRNSYIFGHFSRSAEAAQKLFDEYIIAAITQPAIGDPSRFCQGVHLNSQGATLSYWSH